MNEIQEITITKYFKLLVDAIHKTCELFGYESEIMWITIVILTWGFSVLIIVLKSHCNAVYGAISILFEMSP